MQNINDETTFKSDIGMFCIDRPETSCRHATKFCKEHCYNRKFYERFGWKLRERDKRLKEFWKNIDGEKLSEILDRKRNQTKRVRLVSRGEAFSEESDIEKVEDFLNKNPERDIWIPTRAWRNKKLKKLIEERLLKKDNAYILASTDPSNSEEEINQLKEDGWSTMFFGDDDDTEGKFKCPKTWDHKKGHCAECDEGCFSDKRTDVHMKQH